MATPSDCPRCEYDETSDPNCPWCALESSTPPAQPASPLDTSPRSRTSNAASENGAASFSESTIREFIGWLSADIPELGGVEVPRLADSWERFLDTAQQRIEVSGVESGHAASDDRRSTVEDVLRPTGPPDGTRYQEQASNLPEAGLTTGLTSSVDPFHTCTHTRLKGYTCESCHREQEEMVAKIYGGMQRLKDEAEALVLEPMSEPAIRAAVYGCTDAQCVCGRCGPIKIAVDCSIERVLKS